MHQKNLTDLILQTTIVINFWKFSALVRKYIFLNGMKEAYNYLLFICFLQF